VHMLTVDCCLLCIVCVQCSGASGSGWFGRHTPYYMLYMKVRRCHSYCRGGGEVFVVGFGQLRESFIAFEAIRTLVCLKMFVTFLICGDV
jgi:hypothetical protein